MILIIIEGKIKFTKNSLEKKKMQSIKDLKKLFFFYNFFSIFLKY